MAGQQITLTMRWWFKPAIYLLVIMQMIGLVGDAERLHKWIARNGLVARVG